MNFTQMPMNTEITGAQPPFECQKVEATDNNGNLKMTTYSRVNVWKWYCFPFFFAGKVHVARRCQVSLRANQSCDHFTKTIGYEREYRNASCWLCSTDACNIAQNVHVWPMLFAPTLLLSGLFMFLAWTMPFSTNSSISYLLEFNVFWMQKRIVSIRINFNR